MLLQQGRAPRRVTNVRDDKILASPFWRTSFEQRRCLVPASSYCEPKGEKPATWHWFALHGDEHRPLFAFPGVWTRYRGPLKKDGENVDQEVFAFMTTEPNELTLSINHERMPVLISDPADYETWLSGSSEDAFRLARSYAAEQMRIVQAGSAREGPAEGCLGSAGQQACDYKRFLEALLRLRETLVGETELTFIEGGHAITLTGNGRGGVEARFVIGDGQSPCHAFLTVRMTLDQSCLPDVIHAVGREFPPPP